MVITARVDEKTGEYVKAYCDILEISMSDFIKKAIVEKVDRDIELDIFNESLIEYKEDMKRYGVEEIQSILLREKP